MYTYSVSGTVQNLTGVILPSDQEYYVEFGLLAKSDVGHVYNGVFYIRLVGDEAITMTRVVIKSLVNKEPITVTWTTDAPWDPIHDPSSVICDARATR